MSRHWRVALLLLPLALVVIIFIKISQFRDAISAVPDTSYVFLLARKPAKLLVVLSGLLAMPLCLAVAIGFRKEWRETDEVGNLMALPLCLSASSCPPSSGSSPSSGSRRGPSSRPRPRSSWPASLS